MLIIPVNEPMDWIIRTNRLIKMIRVVKLHPSSHGPPRLLDSLHRTEVPQLLDGSPVGSLYFSLCLGVANPAHGVLDLVFRALPSNFDFFPSVTK